jgi:hypothetical protein
VHIGEIGDETEMAALDGECIFCGEVGDSFDGMMTYDDLRKILDELKVLRLPEEQTAGENPTYEEASELFAKASENLNKMIKDGTIKVVGEKDIPEDATFVTLDKEGKEAHVRHGKPVTDNLEELLETKDADAE